VPHLCDGGDDDGDDNNDDSDNGYNDDGTNHEGAASNHGEHGCNVGAV
jgi:hypothetical protein